MTECIDASIIVKWFHKGEAFDAESHILIEKIIELEHDFVVNEGIIGSRKSNGQIWIHKTKSK